MTTAKVEIPSKLIPVFEGAADVRGSYGGRGSAKTMTFAKMTAVRAYMWASAGKEGIILCGRQYMNSLDDSSLEEIKAAIQSEHWLLDLFEIGEKYIRTKCGRVSYKFSGLDRNISSVKSKSRILLCWVDEAEQVSDQAWTVLIPTIRDEESELWVTWNPERENSATDKRFRQTKDPRYKVVEMNWRDNPKFPGKLERERVRDKENNPDQYDHIWEGGYKKINDGAYYAKQITKAQEEGRLSKDNVHVNVSEDPLMIVRLFVDVGGTGAKADNFVIWAAQFIGQSINWINHYEVQGQPIGHHLSWMRSQGYTPERCKIWLPHDGGSHDKVFDVSYHSAFKKAGYEVEVIPNQGKGAAMKRVEEGRNLFPRMWFDHKCKGGTDALAWYHAKKDDQRQLDLGPDHDWSSHSADAWGLGCVAYEVPDILAEDFFDIPSGGWMSA